MVCNLDIFVKEFLMFLVCVFLYLIGKVIFIILFKEEINLFKLVVFLVLILYIFLSDWLE